LYRSGHFHDVGEPENRALAERNIQLVFDFRSQPERSKKPSRFTIQPEVITLDVDPGSGASFQRALPQLRDNPAGLDATQMAQVMCQINRSLVTDHAAVYKTFFQHVLAHQPSALVIHCASGKDRTGIAAALLLSALGVDRDTVMADYLLTNSCLDVNHHVARAMADFDGQHQLIRNPDALAAMYGVQTEYLAAALDEIDQQGGMQRYLHDQMGLDRHGLEQLQTMYLTE